MRGWKRTVWVHVGILLVYTLLTLMMTWPLVTQMSTHLAGDDVDVWLNPWATWWTRKALSEGLNFYYTDYLFYPQGVSLIFHSFSHLNTALALALEPLVGVIAAQNVTTLLAYALSGFSMYMLVYDLFQSRAAAFVSGIVFAFFPYHLDQILHPVIISTQWIPLFLLFFIRVLDEGNIKQAIAAVIFLTLTALTSWHLFLFTVILAGVYGGGKAIAAWRSRARFVTRSLVVFAVLAGIALLPLMWPMLRERLGELSYGAIPFAERGTQSVDLLAFFVPSCHHPLWGQLSAAVQWPILSQGMSVFFGFSAIAIAAYGLIRRGRPVMHWVIIGVVFWVLSLGPYPRLWGTKLLTLPWGIPLVRLFRVSHRFHLMTTLVLAVLVGWGWKCAGDTLSRWGKPALFAGTPLVSAVILIEYLSVPIPSLPVRISPFVQELGEDPEKYTIIDLPLGRRFGRYYNFQQIFHNKPVVEGVVSRHLPDAYSFIQGSAFWAGLLENGDVDVTSRDVSRHLAYLSQNNIRYIIIHRDLLSEDQLARWRDYFTIAPLYEDDLIVVYPTCPEAGRDFQLASELGAGVGVIRASVSPAEATQGSSLFINVRWGSQASPNRDLNVCLTLVDGVGGMSSETCWELVDGWPTSEWPKGAVGIGDYVFQVDPHLPGGEYTLVAELVEPETGQGVGESVPLETISVRELAPQHVVTETFGLALRLLGYDIAQDTEALRLTLYWRAERRMDVAYKMFVHLYDRDSDRLVAQADVMPRDWTYPTNWWRAGEVVPDEIALSMSEVPEGRYTVAVGVYDSQTGERLPIGDAEGLAEPSDFLILQEVTVP